LVEAPELRNTLELEFEFARCEVTVGRALLGRPAAGTERRADEEDATAETEEDDEEGVTP